MSSKDNVIAQALRLPEDERLEVVEALYESLEGPPEEGADAAWSADIERRLKKIESGQAKFSPWEAARRRIAGEENGKAPG